MKSLVFKGFKMHHRATTRRASKTTGFRLSTLSTTMLTLILGGLIICAPARADLWNEVSHGYADNNGVKIHYATVGKGPLVVMIHGFPDFWYTWRHQMEALQDHYQVVAIDQRGYNKSSAPKGDENYDMRYLVSDVATVIKTLGREKAVIVGHDWGGAVAWSFAFAKPEMVDRLVVLNLPHPRGMAAALANNPAARANTGYAQKFREGKPSDPDIRFGGTMTTSTLSGWVTDRNAQKRYKKPSNDQTLTQCSRTTNATTRSQPSPAPSRRRPPS